MGPVTVDLVQVVIYLGMTAAGYLLSHYGVLNKITPPSPKNGTPAPVAVPNLPPALANIAQVFEQQLMIILQQAVKNLLQQQVTPANGNVPAPQQPASKQ
jgi:hypothetical protein